jgi:hypothetical protein
MTTDHRRLPARAARLLTLPTDPWLSCEDCFAALDRFVDALLADPATPGFRAMRVHLAGCAACAEEAESLLELVAEQDGVDPSAALRRLRAPA